MPRFADTSAVRVRLEQDRAWSAYALGDLSPQFAAAAEWHAEAGGPGANGPLVLVFRAFTVPIVFGIGDPPDLQPLLQEVEAPTIALQLRVEAVPALLPRFEVDTLHPMWRMALKHDAFETLPLTDVVSVGQDHASAVQRLFDVAERQGDAPDFFLPAMLASGFFRGVWHGPELVALAGTHLVAEDMGVCAIGHVYTRADWRGRGLGTRVTAAVAVEALQRGIPTIVLNVRHTNRGALRIYERLGFIRRCDFVEGRAERARRGRSRPESG